MGTERLNLECSDVPKLRLKKYNKMDEFRICSYKSSTLYEEKMKLYHKPKIKKRDLIASDMILLFDSRIKLFQGKLKSRWKDTYRVVTVFAFDAIVLENKKGMGIKINV